ncbi:MAG TPA: zinc-ribbon domain-containing protein [Candidatus Obscuribacterales bacterium]
MRQLKGKKSKKERVRLSGRQPYGQRTPRIEDVVDPYPLAVRRRQPLARTHPEIAQFWLHEKNCGFGPEDFSHGSTVRVWWFCPEGKDHVYQATITDRVRHGKDGGGCPFCRGFKVSATNSLADHFPELAKEWVPGLNRLSPHQVTWGSSRRIWWQCKIGHVWLAAVKSRTRGHGCPKCAGEALDLRNYPKVLKQFDREKNAGIDPTKLSPRKKVWWKCLKSPDHEWFSLFDAACFTSKSERCPFCRGRSASSTNNLTLDKKLLREFHPTKNGALKPENITLGSHTRVWWRCPKGPDHEWQVSVKDRRQYQTGCPFCANKRLSVTNCFAKVAPHAAAEWHPTKNKRVKPEDVIATSMTPYWFKCKNGHDFKQKPFYRTRFNGGCKMCYWTRGQRSSGNARGRAGGRSGARSVRAS